jgi:hypothetical protein
MDLWLDKTLIIIGAAIMSLVVIAATIYISLVLVWQELHMANRDIVLQLVGGYIALFTLVVKTWLDMVVRIFTSPNPQQTMPTTVVTQQSGTQEIKT